MQIFSQNVDLCLGHSFLFGHYKLTCQRLRKMEYHLNGFDLLTIKTTGLAMKSSLNVGGSWKLELTLQLMLTF